MSVKDLKEVIKDFVKRPNKEMALMIHGEWGVGKTYFLKNLNPKELGKERIILVSLKGIKTTNEINQRLLTATWQLGKTFNFFNKAFEGYISSKTAGKVNVNLGDLVGLGFDWQKFNRTILVFDDFERISSENISYQDVLFEIHSTFVEDKNTSVIIVANEDEIEVNPTRKGNQPNGKAKKLNPNEIKYQQAKEKTIERTVQFYRKLQDFFPEYIKTRYSKIPSETQEFLLRNKTIVQILQKENVKNLRDYNRFFDIFVQVHEAIDAVNISISHRNRFLDELLFVLRAPILNSDFKEEIPALETIYLPSGYVRLEMFPSIKNFIEKGFLNHEEFKNDIDRRVKVYNFDKYVKKDFDIIRKWFMSPRQKSLQAFARLIKKSHRFTTYDLFLETARYLNWFFSSGMIEKKLYQQRKETLLKNFQAFLLHLPNINLTIGGMADEKEFIDMLHKCQEIQIQQKLRQYEKNLFTNNRLIEDPMFVEFVRKNPGLVLDMYEKNADKVARVSRLYLHTKFLVSCLKHSTTLALIKPSPWIGLTSKIIDHLEDPAAAAVAQMLLDEIITMKSPSYKKLNGKLKRKKKILLQQDDNKKQ